MKSILEIISEAREFIHKDEVENARKLIERKLKLNDKHTNSVISLSNQLASLNIEVLNNRLKYNDYSHHKAKIITSLLQLLTIIIKEYDLIKTNKKNRIVETINFVSFKTNLFAPLTLVFLIISFSFWFSHSLKDRIHKIQTQYNDGNYSAIFAIPPTDYLFMCSEHKKLVNDSKNVLIGDFKLLNGECLEAKILYESISNENFRDKRFQIQETLIKHYYKLEELKNDTPGLPPDRSKAEPQI